MFLCFYCILKKYLFIWLRWVFVACGIQFPDQGLNLGPLHWELGVLATGPQGSPCVHIFKCLFFLLECPSTEACVFLFPGTVPGIGQTSSKPLSPVHILHSLVVKSLRCGVEQSEDVTLIPPLKSDDGLEWIFQLLGTQSAPL